MDVTDNSSISQIDYISRPYIRRLEKVEHKWGYTDFAQNTIDVIQEWPLGLSYEMDAGNLTVDCAGSLAYRLDVLIGVMNPALTKDIEALTEMKVIAEEWSKEIEQNFKADE